jgi:uncharacterized membrane protein YbhN (UPF0104 family)
MRASVERESEIRAWSSAARHGHLVIGGMAFLLLTAGIFWYQFHRIEVGDATPRWDQLQWRFLPLILLCVPIETFAAGVRMWVVCRTLQPEVRLRTCIKAEWANVAISLLTPSQSGGGPGQIYILSRKGVSLGTALTISLLGFVGTMVGLVGMGLYSLAASDLEGMGTLFVAAVWTLTAIGAAMVIAAAWPGLFRLVLGMLSRAWWRVRRGRHPLSGWWPPGDSRTGPPVDRLDRWTARLVDIVYTYRTDVGRFVRAGKASFAWVCLLSLTFLFSRSLLAYLCVRFLGIGASTPRHIVEMQMALIFLVFFAPTPGSAGVAEGASLSLMAEIVPAGFAPYYNLLWRLSTAYLAALAGLFCLLQAALEDARRVMDRPAVSQEDNA